VKQADSGPVNVNLFGIRQHECPAARPNCDPLTSLTLVMPLEITVDRDAVLVINDRGKDLTPIPLRIIPDKIHILNSCEAAAIFIGIAQEAQGRCAPMLQSRNGRLISRGNPARPGDTVIAWAYGIGFPGRRAQPPNFELSNVPNPPELFFNFRANAGAMRRIGDSGARPTFAGELGSSGLYQMNFVIPEIPSGLNLPTCEEGLTDSNLTVLVVGQTSSDSLRMCIRP
jgi:uncharacterized protein (TIGR03437 family)